MLIVQKVDENCEGSWSKLKIRDEEVELKIRPITTEVLNTIRNKHKSVKNIYSAELRGMEKTDVFDEKAIQKALIDYALEDWRGIGATPDEPLEVTYDNKILVMEIPTLEGEISVADFVFEEARRTAALGLEEYEKLEKN